MLCIQIIHPTMFWWSLAAVNAPHFTCATQLLAQKLLQINSKVTKQSSLITGFCAGNPDEHMPLIMTVCQWRHVAITCLLITWIHWEQQHNNTTYQNVMGYIDCKMWRLPSAVHYLLNVHILFGSRYLALSRDWQIKETHISDWYCWVCLSWGWLFSPVCEYLHIKKELCVWPRKCLIVLGHEEICSVICHFISHMLIVLYNVNAAKTTSTHLNVNCVVDSETLFRVCE